MPPNNRNLVRQPAENALFADGIHDDLLTNLTHIAALKVISRTSVMNYRDTTKNLGQIADELGVATVLEGAVQRAGNMVRINVQLIDANTDEHLWAEIYDRQLTATNIFEIQSEMATAIAGALLRLAKGRTAIDLREPPLVCTAPADSGANGPGS